MADTTVTVKSSGGNYTSLNAALSGESYNLTNNIHNSGQAGILTIDCYNFEDTTEADTGTGYITDADHYINIKAHDSHGGKWSTGAYRYAWNGSGYRSTAINIRAELTQISGIQFLVNNTAYFTVHGVVINSVSATIKNCIITETSSGRNGSCALLYLDSIADKNVYIINNIIYGSSTTYNTGIQVFDYKASAGTGGVYLYNNTIYRTMEGIRSGYQQTNGCLVKEFKNNLVNNAGTCYVWPIYISTHSTNISSDTTSPDDTFDSKTVTFVDANGDDFHLASNDTNAINVGTDLSAIFTTDIDGETRPTGAGTWDIGADEYIATGGTPLNIFGIEMPWAQSANYR